jgi:glutathione S-transferase
VKRFTLYGSPHSLPTYKVALMLRLSGEPFSFRYVSFQKGMHKTPEFLALSRWGQVPVLVDNGRIYNQSAAIVEYLADTLFRFGQRGLLPIDVEPTIAEYHRQRAETALSVLDSHLAHRNYLCALEPTIADIFCYGDVAFAEVCGFDLNRCLETRQRGHPLGPPGHVRPPFALLEMGDAELS